MTSRRINSPISETKTEKIFRQAYGLTAFIEKSAIPAAYGFKSKKGTSYKGYPDFFKEEVDYCIVVEAKADDIKAAEDEVQYYAINNKIRKDIIAVAVSGQTKKDVLVSYYLRTIDDKTIIRFAEKNSFVNLSDLHDLYLKYRYGKKISDDELKDILVKLNKRFHEGGKIRDTDRSLFFSGIMIALKNANFRSIYKQTQPPTKAELAATKSTVLESCHLNDAILSAIDSELANKINNLSKEYNWKDKFAFIKNVDYPLSEYIDIIKTIEYEIFYPFQYQDKQDILGRAYKIFLSKAGKVDNKNIILTPDHIKSLMVKLARLDVNDIVLDTCTGSGGFLMEAMETLVELANGDLKQIKHIKEQQLIGFEIDPVLFALACSNMFLHGDGRTNLLFRSSLINDSNGGVANNSDDKLLKYIKKKKPNKIIINPPYENNSPIKFTKQAIDYLEPNGKLIIIMPTPTLTHNQGGMTDEILKVAKLDFVIKLPNKLFSEQNRTVNTSIFGFTKTAHKPNDDVLFYDLSDDGFESIQHKGRVDVNNSWATTEKQIVQTILNSRTIKGICVKKKIYRGKVLNCAGVQNRKRGSRKSLKIGQLFDVSFGNLQSSKAVDGSYPFITADDEWKTHDDYSHDCEAIIFVVAAGGSLGKTHYVNGKFVASNLCIILTAKKKSKYPINMQFYNYYFMSIRKQLVDDLADGTSKLTIDPEMLKEYYVDYFNMPEQNAFVTKQVDAYLKAKQQFEKASSLFMSEVDALKS